MVANLIITLGPALATLVANAIARHEQGLPPATGIELAAELQTIQTTWQQDEMDAEALAQEGHTADITETVTKE